MLKTITSLCFTIILANNIFSQCVPPLVLTTSSTPTTCGLPNGTANVLITDPVGTYSYSWSPGGGNTSTVTDLPSGNYTVTVTDANSCSVTGSVTIASSQPLTLTPSSTSTLCNQSNGTASVAVTNGTTPYTYAWTSNGGTAATAQNLPSGNYNVTVTDANNCTATTTVSVIASNAPVVSVSTVPSSCTGATGSATLSATGGTGNYNFMWLHDNMMGSTRTGLAAGTYVVLVTDGNCSVFQTVIITKQQNTLNINTFTYAAGCGLNGGEIVAFAASATGTLTYEWTPNVGSSAQVINLAAGTYTVKITDANGCTGTQTATVATSPLPTVNILSISHPTCFGAHDGFYTYSVNNGAPITSYSSFGAGTFHDTIKVAAPYQDQCRVSYSVTFIDPPQINVAVTTNPSACGASDGSAAVNVSNGVAPYDYLWSNSNTSSSISAVSAGSYSVAVTDANGCSVNQFVEIPSINGPNLTMNATPALCGNGSASVVVTDGTAPYTYSWSPSGGTNATASNLTEGFYTVTVTDDNGCIGSGTVKVDIQHSLTISTPGIPYSCENSNSGTIYAGVTGGSPSYTYLWSNGETTSSILDLNPGIYSVFVTDANGCTGFKEIQINLIQKPIAQITNIKNPSCFGGSDGGYTLAWTQPEVFGHSPSTITPITISGLPANSTPYTGTNAGPTGTNPGGCATASFSVMLVDPPQIVSTISAVPGSCSAPGSATVSASGGTGALSYSWSNGGTGATASNLNPGTYTVTVTDDNGCSVNETVVITSSSTLNLSAVSTPASCGLPDGTATVSVSGGAVPYTYSWSPGGATGATASGLLPGTYTVTVTDDSNCSGFTTVVVASSSVNVTATATPTSCGLPNGTATAVVTGGTVPYTYSWSPGGETTATASNLAAGTYTVTVTDDSGCSVDETVVVTTSSAISVTATATPTSCGLSDGTATAVVTGGTTPYTYSWSPGGQTTATASNLAAGTYTVTVTDDSGCSVDETVVVGTSSAISVTVTATPTSCGLSDGTATAAVTGGTAPYTYSWSPGSETTATVSDLAAGTYTVTVTDDNGCSVDETVVVGTSSAISVTTTATPTSCGLSNGTATVVTTGGVTPYTYSWSPGSETTATVSDLATGTYTVTVTDDSGCSVDETVVVTASTVVSVTTTVTPTSCGLSNGTATAVVTGGITPYTYSWSPGGAIAATASNLAAGTYTVTVTDGANCTATQTASISSSTGIVATANSTPTSCGLSNGTVNVMVTGGGTPYTYSWSPGGETTASVANLPAGTYTVTVSNVAGCTATDVVDLYASPSITATTSSTPASCGTSTGGSATVSATGGSAPYTYAWSPAGGTGATASNLSPGTYTVIVTDANSCSVNASVTIATANAPSVTVSGTAITCFGQANGSATAVATGGAAPYTYTWSPSGATGATASGLLAGPHVVTVTDNNGCSVTETVSISEPASLAVTTSGTPAGCSGSLGTVNAIAAGGVGTISYTWQPGNLQGQSQSGLAAGIYTVTATDANGCSATGSSTISLTGSLSVDATPVTSWIDAGDTVALSATAIPGATYIWSPASGLSCTNCQDPLASPSQNTVYTVAVTAPNGCSGTADAAVMINIICGGYFIPTIFSPNGDGKNDEFSVLGNCISDLNVKVYDRWGEKVFETTDQQQGWDGTFKGQPMNTGSFMYVVQIRFSDGRKINEKGNLGLVR